MIKAVYQFIRRWFCLDVYDDIARDVEMARKRQELIRSWDGYLDLGVYLNNEATPMTQCFGLKATKDTYRFDPVVGSYFFSKKNKGLRVSIWYSHAGEIFNRDHTI